MSTIGTVTIPESDLSTTFPLASEFPFVTTIQPTVVAHSFNAGDRKIQQRFLIGENTRRFQLNFSNIPQSRYGQVTDFFVSIKGPYSTFLMNNPNGSGTIRVRWVDETFTLQMASD